MSETTATRTLVKSPPELWAECSDASSLSRHLPQFGEITITKLDPETAVAWEGERVSGTVRIEPSGWGTKVTLTACPDAVEAAAPVAPPVEPEPVVEEPVEPEPVLEEPAAVVEPEPVTEEPAGVVEPEPVTEEPAVSVAPSRARSGGFFARLLERFGLREASAPAAVRVAAAVPEPAPRVAEPEPEPAPEPAPEPMAEAEPEPSPEAMPIAASQPQLEPESSPPPPSVELAELESALAAALDSLGQAHHRPFSRA